MVHVAFIKNFSTSSFYFLTQHFKCYLSKPDAYKEDPHWFSVIGFLTVAGGHGGAELSGQKSANIWGV